MARGPLRIAIEDFINTFNPGDALHRWLATISYKIETEAITIYENIADDLGITQFIPPSLSPATLKNRTKLAPAWLPVVLSLIGGLIMGVAGGIMSPLNKVFAFKGERIFKTYRPDPATAALMLRRDPQMEFLIVNEMRDLGLNEDLINAYRHVTEQILTAFQLEALRLRGLLSESEYKLEMSRQGFTDERIEQVKKLAQQIPGPGDLIRMAVREAWNEEVVQRFQYDADFPAQFADWMTKQGYSSDWAKRYWRSHWELPGLSSGYEMLHRLRPGTTNVPFTEADLELLLKTADIPQFFRRRLLEISYAPYTRVDVRRMFGAGVLNADQVYQAYRDLGYDDLHARNLTAFTTSVEKAEEKGLTKDAAVGGYKRGIIDRATATSMLRELGYSPDDAAFWLNLVDYDLAADLTDEKLKAIEYQYENGLLDESTVNDKLGPLNLPSERQTGLLTLWTAKRDAKIKLPSKSELETFYERGLIDDTRFREFLKSDGYRADTIPLYLQSLNIELAEKAQKEVERAAKEADRLAKLKTASALQRLKAEKAAEIAALQLDIANLRVALFDATEDEQIAALKKAILDDQAEIAALRLDVAEASVPPETS